jgi:Tfp pilus assembly protein PilX
LKTERSSERGSILASVLVTSVVVAVIAAGIMRLTLMRSQMSVRSALVLEEKRDTTGAMNAVVSQWSQVTGATSVCSGPPPGWGGCSNPGVCGCTCTQPGPNGVTVVAAPAALGCKLTITSVDRSQ